VTPIQRFIMRRGEPMKSPYTSPSHTAEWCLATDVDELEQRLHPTALARYGYEKARRIGMVAMVGGKDKERIRDATPIEFRDVLLAIAGSASKPKR
jgi:hypothetical protein